MKRILTLFFVLVFTTVISAQHTHRCGHESWMHEINQINPQHLQDINSGLKKFRSSTVQNSESRNVSTLAVHVILVHPTGQSVGSGVNFDLDHVMSQIDVLNEDFRRTNSDAGNTPSAFPTADSEIEFCLASTDPDGEPTDGITRYPFDGNFVSNASSIRQETRWPRSDYINIWVAPNLPYLGQASVPSQFGLPSANNDFIHVDSGTFGGPGYATDAPYNLGRTTTHEMGHYLGLLHVWGSGNGGCGQDDFMDDTPTQNDSNFGCPDHPSPSCNNGGDMFMNYMDYVNDDCMNAFTPDQASYMNLILSTSRAGLADASATACASVDPLEISVDNITHPTCFGFDDGNVQISAIGGVSPYTFTIEGGESNSTGLFEMLGAGFYTINVQDNSNNFESIEVELIDPQPINSFVQTTPTTCSYLSDGAAEIFVEGGTAPFMYSTDGINFSDINEFEDLSSGFYTYSVLDFNDCIFNGSFNIDSPDELILTTDTLIHVACNGDSTGIVDITASGGTGTYSYTLGDLTNSSGYFDSLPAGLQQISVEDENLCFTFLEVILEEVPTIEVMSEVSNVTCHGQNNGSIQLELNGGNGGFSTSIDGSEFEENQFLFENLGPGTYNILVQDSLGCDTALLYEILEPAPLISSIQSMVNTECSGTPNGSIILDISDTEAEITINGEVTTNTIENLANGTYEITVENTICNEDTTIMLVNDDLLFAEITDVTPINCNGEMGGNLLVFIDGNQGSVNYSIDNQAVDLDNLNLPAGAYMLTVMDDACELSIPFEINEPDEITLSTQELVEIICDSQDGGSITLTSDGGNNNKIFSLTSELVGNIENSTGVFENLPMGRYDAKVIDDKGCMKEIEVKMTYTDGYFAEILSITDLECFGIDGGSLDVVVEGGVGEYTYYVDQALEVTPDDLMTHSGIHTFDIIDETDCLISLEFEIGEPDFYEITEVVYDGTNATIEAIGGTPPYTYSFDGGNTFIDSNVGDVSNTQGEITLYVKDSNDCILEEVLVVSNVTDYHLINELNVYPNPVNNWLDLRFNLTRSSEVDIEIFDLLGQKVYNISDINYHAGENSVKINMSDFASSMYIVNIALAEDHRTIKVIKK